MKFDGLDNLALGKTAQQSSTSDNFSLDDASRALADDGKQDFAFHTDIEDTPWWQVDLEDVYPIYYIVIGNRRKTCQERAITLTVETSLDGSSWQLIHTGFISWSGDLVWPLGGLISARFVRVSLREKTYLHLAKVDIWGLQEGGLKPKLKRNNLLWAETKLEGLQELHAVLTNPAGVSLTEMILDLDDFQPIWALELATPPGTGFERVKDLKIEVSIEGSDWRTIHEGLLFWTGRLYYPLQGEIMARFIKISRPEADKKKSSLRHIFWSLRQRLSDRRDGIIYWPLVKVFTRRQPDLQVRALRNDGLGSRLMNLLNAMYVAKLLGCDYKVIWPGLNVGMNASHIVSLDGATDFFGDDFIQDHLLVNERPDHTSKLHYVHDLCRRHLTISTKQDKPGIIHSTFHDPVSFYHTRLAPSGYEFKSLFERLSFSPAFQEILTMARRVELPPNYLAVHLRGGDVVFSNLRNEILWRQEKAAPLSLAKMALEKLRGEKRPIILFGQDVDALAYLASLYKISLGTDYLPSSSLTRPKCDLFEIILMSRASRIYACHNSYYACCASWIGGQIKQDNLHEIASSEEKTAYITADLERNAASYHPLQNSFAYLYLYHLNHLTAGQEELIFYLNQAQTYDPENEVINILQASEYFKHHQEKAGEELLGSWLNLAFDLEQQTIRYAPNAFFLRRKCLNFHIENYLQPLKAAAEQGYPNAAACLSVMYDLMENRNKEQAMFWRGLALGSWAARRHLL